MITKRKLKRALLSTPDTVQDSALFRAAFRTKEKFEARFGAGRGDDFEAPDGYPIPPAELRVAISTIADAENHWQGGVVSRKAIDSILASNGLAIVNIGTVLDFGSGAGRVLRQWQGVQGTELNGCDYNQAAIKWASKNLTFATWVANQLEPPLPYGDDRFDLVYALSVFTHFPERLQDAWMAEMARVVKSGGHLIFTTMGNSFREHLTEPQQEIFDSKGFVVHFPDSAGSNMCAAYHSPGYAGRLAEKHGFEVIETVEVAPDSLYPQDMHLVRLRA